MRFGKLQFIHALDTPGRERWLMKCDCGTEKEFLATNVKRGLSTTCGSATHRAEDLTGMRFGCWYVVGIAKSRHGAKWNCQCDCGNYRDVFARTLKQGTSTKCNVCGTQSRSDSCVKDLTGKHFGRLTALNVIERRKEGALWRCICTCGKHHNVLSRVLIAGRTISCGCAVERKLSLMPEGARAKAKIVRKRRRNRLRDSGGTYSRKQIDHLYILQKGKCAWCHASLVNGFHKDHRFPVALGGSNDIWNIELLCRRCNMRKNSKDPIIWANENGKLL